METPSTATDGGQPAGTEQKVESGIDFAAQCAKMFGFGAPAAEIEPLAMVGVHLGFAIAHLCGHIGKSKPAAKSPAQPSSTSQPASQGQPA